MFLEQLRSTRKKARLFPKNHKFVRSAAEGLLDGIYELMGARTAITFSIRNDEVYLEGDLLASETLEYGDLLDDLVSRDLISWTIEEGVSLAEVSTFVCATNEKKDIIDDAGGWAQFLLDRGVEHIRPNWRFALEDGVDDEEYRIRGLPREVYEAVREATLAAFMDAESRQLLNIELLEDVVGMLVSTVAMSDDIVALVNDIREADEYTLSHSVNVSILSLLIGTKLNLPVPLLHSLGVAALVHDIGKTKVPEEILNKSDQLTPDEWVIMQSHTLEGVKILTEQKTVDHLCIVIAAQHHARVDLKGYPTFHALSELHTLSKLVAVADCYDAITSNRSYRKALLPDRALKILIEGIGTQFDPSMLKVFAQMVGMFPVGTCVLLDSGDFGVVVKANPSELYRPVIRIAKSVGTISANQPIINLAAQDIGGKFTCNIVRSIEPEEHGLDPLSVI